MVTPLRTFVAAAIVAGVSTIGLLTAGLGRVDAPAMVDERADRGEAVRVGDTVPPPPPSYRLPVADVARAAWSETHTAYPATDIFVDCGAELVSPVDGIVSEVRRVDRWDPSTDDPADRGGRTVSVIGADGVRYYLAHFAQIAGDIEPGRAVTAGHRLGTMGDSGRASACHVHFGISPPCPTDEWWVRRGVIWPGPYLDAWRRGEPRSPQLAVAVWATANPGACTSPPAGAFSR